MIGMIKHSDFLLGCYANMGPILHRFRDIAGFCTLEPTPNTVILGRSRWYRSPMLGSAQETLR